MNNQEFVQNAQNDELQAALEGYERRTRRPEPPAAPEKPAPRKKRRAAPLPPWLLVIVSFLFDTILFHIWIKEPFNLGRWFGILLFALALGMLFSLIATISRNRRTHLILGLVVSIFWAVMFLIEYFVWDSFKNFFTISQLISGSGNAGQEDFSARTFNLILTGFWRILLYALPIVAFLLINRYVKLRRRIMTRGVRKLLFVGGSVLLAVAFFFAMVISADTRTLTDQYNFTAATEAYGLPVALIRDQINGGRPTGDPLGDLDGPIVTHEWDVVPSSTGAAPVVTDPSGETGTGPVETTEPKEPVKPYSVLPLDFESLIASAKSDRVATLHKYVNSLTPSKTNEMTGLFKGKNLIFITAESFSKEVIREDLTPTLYRMYTKGITFTDYYQPAWGGSTSTGEFTNLTGLEPYDGVKSMVESADKNMYFTMGNQLMRLGYFSRAYHNHTYNYYSRDLTHENLGYEKYIGVGTGMEEGVTKAWPESDLEMIDFTVPQYIDHQPFSIYYMTVSGHGLYSWAGSDMSRKHKDEVQGLNASEHVKAYIAANLELEAAMKSLIEQLEAAGIADDTVIVLTTDHYPYALEPSDTWGIPDGVLDELYGYPNTDCFTQDHNALLIWSGCLEDKNIVVDDPVYSLDIVPTLSNLFGTEWDSRLLPGRDVFSDAEPLVLWPNCSWKTDLGKYNARTGKFTPNEGVTVPEGYTDRIDAIVRQKIRYSDECLDLDYFDILFGH